MPPAKEDIIGVKTYTKDLLAYTLSKVAQIEIAEDLVQETFISAYQSYEKFEERSNVKTWLFSILKHKIADYYPTKYKKSIEVPSDVVARLFNEDHGWKKEYRPVVEAPIKLTTSGRGKLTTCFAGEDLVVQVCQC